MLAMRIASRRLCCNRIFRNLTDYLESIFKIVDKITKKYKKAIDKSKTMCYNIIRSDKNGAINNAGVAERAACGEAKRLRFVTSEAKFQTALDSA